MKIIPLLFLILSAIVFSAKSQIVINEIYGGGGNSGSTYKNDFIELYNTGSSAVDLAGWSVQYASSTGTTWQVTNLTGSIAANGYYLIQEATGAGGTTNLPTPDITGTIAMSATAGKIALVNSVTALTGSCPTGFTDLAGYGTAANCFEGTGPAPAPSNIISLQRTPVGTDTQDNGADFTTGAPSPNNSAGPDVIAPGVINLVPANTSANVATSFTANITFTESVIKGASGNILIKKGTDNTTVQTINITASSVTTSGADIFFPVNSLALNTAYYIEISAGAFKDIAGNEFTGISGNSSWNFTTIANVPLGVINSIYNFNTCASSIADGFTVYTATGAEVWGCTAFGRDPANPAGTAPFESAVQINGFSNGTNVVNEDWFISPSFDLTLTTYPLLSFWSRTAFNGAPLQLKVSTDYPGTGDPGSYTWSDVEGKFPAQAGNTWVQSQNINLATYKSAHTYFAFVYRSSAEDGARWTVDDISVNNSALPPPASLMANTTDISFGYVPISTTTVKNFTFTGYDLTGDVTLTAAGNYLLSKTPGNFTASINYTQAEANNSAQTVYVQFLPTQNSINYIGNITVSTTDVADTIIHLSGNSIDDALTLEVVNWNVEWFGSSDPALGPPNKVQQETNIKTITQNISADIFSFCEVVSETKLQNIVANLNSVYGAGTYSYVLSAYGSHTNPFEAGAGPLAEAQKEAFVYKTAVISPVGTPGALITNGVNTAADLTNPAYNYFSSGRYPFMMYANVTLGGVTKPVRFVLLHAKANTSPTVTSYNRRKSGADTLHYTLNHLYPEDNIILLGDFNDDLDQSITAGFTVSSYTTFTADTASFYSPTLALSLAGKKSTVSYNDMIDHVELSNEMQLYYMKNTAGVLSDVSSLVNNYGTTTSDHYPVFSRYAFDPLILPVNFTAFTLIRQNNSAILHWTASREINSKTFIIERSTDGLNWVAIGSTRATGNSNTNTAYAFTDHSPESGKNYYRLKQVDVNGKFQYSPIRIVSFDNSVLINVSPNPAKDYINIKLTKNRSASATINVIDVRGKLINKIITSASSLQMNTSKFTKGVYFIKVVNGKEVSVRKLVIQ